METENRNSVKIKRRKIVIGFMLPQQTINTRNSFSKKNFHRKQSLIFWYAISISNHCEKKKLQEFKEKNKSRGDEVSLRKKNRLYF